MWVRNVEAVKALLCRCATLMLHPEDFESLTTTSFDCEHLASAEIAAVDTLLPLTLLQSNAREYQLPAYRDKHPQAPTWFHGGVCGTGTNANR